MKNIYKEIITNDVVKQENPVPQSVREDLDAGLRFLHFMGMQTKHDLIDVNSRLFALIEELVASGLVDLRHFDERRLTLKDREEARLLAERSHVQLDETLDKYSLDELPCVDCVSRMDICKGRCCKLTFPLSFQDLDEHILQWSYSIPYQIRQNPDGFCVHRDTESGHCTVYENRPAVCRQYDCRNDKRIWVDFEAGTLASEDAIYELQEK